MLVPAVVASVGLLLASGLGRSEPSTPMRIFGGLLVVAMLPVLWRLAEELRRPRLAYADGCLIVYLRSDGPVRVPVDIVECFFLGQSPSLLPGRKYERTETSSVVVRLAERAADWQRFDVKPALGKWCEGYITIRGTWCEPLNLVVVNKLNHRLAEVSRQLAGGSPT